MHPPPSHEASPLAVDRRPAFQAKLRYCTVSLRLPQPVILRRAIPTRNPAVPSNVSIFNRTTPEGECHC
jgi:hypothetical protein